MLKQVRLLDCVGRTIVAVRETYVNDPAFVVVFSDGTFCQIVAHACYDSVEIDDSDRLEPWEANGDHIEAGVVAPEEVAAARRAREMERARATEVRERREFARLRAKFGEG